MASKSKSFLDKKKVPFGTTATTKWGPPYRRNITNTLRLGQPRNFGSILGTEKIFVFSETSSPTLPPSPHGYQGSSLRVKRWKHEADLSPPSSAEVKKE